MNDSDNLLEVYIGSDNRLKLSGVVLTEQDDTNTFLNAGDCSYEIKTLAGVLVANDDNTLQASGDLSYVGGTDGEYDLVIDKTVTLLLTYKRRYDLFVYFNEDGNEATFRRRIIALYQSGEVY